MEAIDIAEKAQEEKEDGVKSRPVGSVHRFWICAGPLFESVLFMAGGVALSEISEYLGESAAEDGASQKKLLSSGKMDRHNLRFFDADGAMVNEVSLLLPRGKASCFELGPFLSSAKLEGGLQHGLLEVSSTVVSSAECRMQALRSSSRLGAPTPLTNRKSTFLPVGLSKEREQLVVLTNYADERVAVKCRFFKGKRNPEFDVILPAKGSRVFGVRSEFADYIDLTRDEVQDAYVRLSTRSEGVVGVQLLERIASKRETGVFTSIS